MKTSDFDYNLPSEFIAQSPAEPRDSSKLMVVDREKESIEHRTFSDIHENLRAGDVLVWNNSKVFKARLFGTPELDEDSDGIVKRPATDRILNAKPVEIFLIRPKENRGVWQVLAKPGRRLRLGMKIRFADDFFCEVMLKEADGTFLAQFADDDMVVRAKANKYGSVPTPPYVKNAAAERLAARYQTVYAGEEGSVAAPTAGFHFTESLIEDLKRKGVEFAEVTLHVGLGTFMPVKTEKIEEHKMHAEWVEITDRNADIINRAKQEKRRVVVVGTTTVRALEGVFSKFGALRAYDGDINIFITPGFNFQVTDALITNFHLPKSTLLMLVAAFAGNREFVLKCYEEAKQNNYRFYSFGDAMFIS